MTCRECGGPSEGFYCRDLHRQAFHNRRQIRGALMYDLVMSWRSDRKKGGATLVSRLAEHFRLQDEWERGGRLSWLPEQHVVGKKPFLRRIISKRRPV
jgi:hypothetical protein